MRSGVGILFVLLGTIGLSGVDGRGRGGGRGGRSRTGSRHSASSHRFSAVGINRNPVKLIAILPFGSPELESYPAREGYFPCPQSGPSFQLPTESEYILDKNNHDFTPSYPAPSGHINGDLLSTNQFVYICFNETKPSDEPIDAFDTTIAVVVVLLIFGILFDLTRRSTFQGPNRTSFNNLPFFRPPPSRRSLPQVDEDHIRQIQRMAQTSRRMSSRPTRTLSVTTSTVVIQGDDPSISPSVSVSRKSSEDKPPSYSEVASSLPPPSYEETMTTVRMMDQTNAHRLLNK